MGNYLTINMEENFKRNQDFINEINNIKIERQIQLNNLLRERQVAMQIAKSRELFFWYSAFYVTAAAISFQAFRRKKNLVALLPMVPLTFVWGYQTDLAYGNKIHRIIAEAEHILQYENHLLALPLGLPTASSIDIKRLENDEQKKLHPVSQKL